MPDLPPIQLTPRLWLDTEQRKLTDDQSSTITLSRSENRLLEYLVARRNEVCSKEELLAAGWPGRVVEYTSLAQSISLLRKKLQSQAGISLNTLSRRGYQLCLPETDDSSEQPEAQNLVPEGTLCVPRPNRNWLYGFAALVAVLAIAGWYFSSLHQAIKLGYNWTSDKPLSLAIDGARAQVTPLVRIDGAPLDIDQLQKRILTQSADPTVNLKGRVMTNELGYSVALCQQQQNNCDKPWLNLVLAGDMPGTLDYQALEPFVKQALKNQDFRPVKFPRRAPAADETREELYHGQIYVVNAGMMALQQSLSLVFFDEDSGTLSGRSQLIEQHGQGKPMQYQVTGRFNRYRAERNGQSLELFHITDIDHEFEHAQQIAPSALPLYRQLRHQSLQKDDQWLVRFTDNNQVTTFVIPMFGGTLMTLSRQVISV